jgi:hypothetical protein
MARASAASRLPRRAAALRSSVEYSTLRLRPDDFAAYIAKSASPRSFSIEVRGSRV